jgi:hypothetical protein
MSSTPFFELIASGFQFIFGFYDWVGNLFNYSCIGLGFFGLFYWLNAQKKMSQKAADNNTLK